MKCFISILLMTIAVSQCSPILYDIDSEESLQQLWEDFKVNYSIWYETASEDENRAQIFAENVKYINEHNERYANGESSYYLGVNKFSHMTYEEFSTIITPPLTGGPHSSPEVQYESVDDSSFPTSLDWRKKGAVTPVKDQGLCGSCWAFSTTGALEGYSKIKNKQLVSLSEQQLMDCDWLSFGCFGGDMDNAFKYVGIFGSELEQMYPYNQMNFFCRYIPLFVNVTIQGTHKLTGGEIDMMFAIQKQPLSIGVRACKDWQSYKGGIYDNKTCHGKLNHGVLAVGYGEENDKPYWIVKNSWSYAWGEMGYIRIERYQGVSSIGAVAYAPY